MEEELDRAEMVPTVELTVPKIGAFSEDGRDPSLKITRVCEDCGKVFSSGKAYGGHKRIHSQPTKEAPATEPAPIKKEDFNSENNGKVRFSDRGEDIRCTECDRGFPTWKSLFGHMRSHPERSWRGVRPPRESHVRASNCSSSSTLSWEEGQEQDPTGRNFSATAGSAVNLMELLKGSWPATAKRGRCALINNNSAARTEDRDRDEEHKMKEAVNDLLMFAQIQQPNQEDFSEGSLLKEAEATKKRRKKRRLTELDQEPASDIAEDGSKDREFACDICNKQFPSHQALGGHKASHNKLRKPEPGTGILSSVGWLDGGEVEQHKCNICSLSFPTGQALGGHKRRHWLGSPAGARGSSSQGTREGSRTVIEFDLNEIPPVEDEQVNVHSFSACNSVTD